MTAKRKAIDLLTNLAWTDSTGQRSLTAARLGDDTDTAPFVRVGFDGLDPTDPGVRRGQITVYCFTDWQIDNQPLAAAVHRLLIGHDYILTGTADATPVPESPGEFPVWQVLALSYRTPDTWFLEDA